MRMPGMPNWDRWNDYKFKHIEDLNFKYARAKEAGYKVWEYEMLQIANDQSRDLQPDGKGGFRSDNTAVNRDKLRVETMWKLMKAIMPQVYGDKIEQHLTGKGGEALQITVNIGAKTSEGTKGKA